MSLLALIPLFPLVGFLINGLGFRKIPHSLVAPIGIGASLLSFIFTYLAYSQLPADGSPIIVPLLDWITIGEMNIPFSFQLDQLSIIMLFVITGVGTLIHVYSMGYMSHDEGYGKFFAFLNLFLFSMLLLVMGSNFVIMFIGWEGVGLCSYLLIGFWNKNTNYGDAARKAFIMNRVGDLGFLIGIFLIFQEFGTVEYVEVFKQAESYTMGNPTLMLITFFLFVGAMGKSAQIPLYTWLPDAMAGPTPVSALIHAATMVTSGIYMIIRSNVLYTLSPDTLEFIAWIGVATALLGATIGIYQNDIKKVLAYSTVSQLGYMFIGLGVMAYSSGLFHVITHAFFKALLFLGAGSVIHAMSDEQDIRKMGGLFGKIKITAITFLLGTIAISGIPPFSGFFSKDEILAHTFEHNKLMWGLALLGSFMTAFYMFRLFFVTFFGSFRGSKEQESHLHESPSSMTIPLIVLSVLAMLGGLIGLPVVFHLPHALATFLEPIFVGSKSVNPTFGEVHLSHATEWILMGVSVSVAAVAILFAYVKFGKGNNVPKEDIEMTGVAQVVYQKYYIDEAYDTVFVKSSVFLSNFFAKVIDTKLIDGLVNGIGALTVTLSGYIRRIQTGATGVYVFAMVVGIVVVFVVSFAPDLVQTFLHLGK